MTQVITTVTEYETKALEALTKVQDEILGYVEHAVDVVDGRISELDVPFELPEIPAFARALDEVPTLSEVVDTQFAFSKKLLATQETFARNLVKTVAPLTREGAKPGAARSRSKAAA